MVASPTDLGKDSHYSTYQIIYLVVLSSHGASANLRLQGALVSEQVVGFLNGHLLHPVAQLS